VFHRVAENLYRLEQSGGYYALLKRGDKQFRRSLKTKDRKLAERRLTELRAQVGNLTIGDDARLSFEEVAERWMASTAHTIKPSTTRRRQTCIKNLAPFFAADGELKFVQEWPFENRFSFLGFSSRLQKGICSSGPGWIFFRS
jgi:hypothetical protein